MAFVFFGVAGLARAGGAEIRADWFYPAILVGLGLAGLISLAYRGRAGP